MLIGIATLFSMLFGGGSLEVFYLDELDKGIKKEVVDKDRKKELLNETKAYTKTVKEFNKTQKGHLKTLQQKNLDRGTVGDWYIAFYEQRMKERMELQNTFINQRLNLQQKVTDDEWEKIMSRSASAESKMEKKEQKKEMKKNDENFFKEQETAIVTYITDQDRRMIVLEALGVYEATYSQLHDTYENINVENSAFLADKYASKEKMQILADLLNEQRVILFEGYSVFLLALQINATDEEWKPIMKAFNKMLAQ